MARHKLTISDVQELQSIHEVTPFSPVNVQTQSYDKRMKNRRSSLLAKPGTLSPIHQLERLPEHEIFIDESRQPKHLSHKSKHPSEDDVYRQFIRRPSVATRSYKDMSTLKEDEFTEEAFALPPEELLNEIAIQQQRESVKKLIRQIEIKRKSCNTISKNMRELEKIAKLPDKAFARKTHTHENPKYLRQRRAKVEAQLELKVIKDIVRQRVYDESINEPITEDNLPIESTIENPQIGSVEEKINDLRHEQIEKWCAKHGKVAAQKFTSFEKRSLRKWFRALDSDGSGEVSVRELSDALLSSGIFKTKEQVVRILANIDVNQTYGVDFEELLEALHGNKIADIEKLRRLQNMSANPYGFSMATLLSEERRIKFLRSIFYFRTERQMEFAAEVAKVDKILLSQKSSEKEKTKCLEELQELEDRHYKEIIFHNRYIQALKGVVLEKLEDIENAELEFMRSSQQLVDHREESFIRMHAVKDKDSKIKLPPIHSEATHNPFWKYAPIVMSTKNS